MFADALSMGMGDALRYSNKSKFDTENGQSGNNTNICSTKAQNDAVQKEREREAWEFANYPEGEIDEMVQIYTDKGMSEEDARTVVTTMAKYVTNSRSAPKFFHAQK